MKVPKQVSIDSGQIGGTIQIVVNSMFIFNLVTFINTCAIAYDSFLHKYVSLATGIVIIASGAIIWWILYYSVVYPSIITFANRQGYKHKNPIRTDIERIEKKIDELVNK